MLANVFDDPAFGVIELSKTVSRMPYVPGRVGRLAFGPETQDFVATTTVMAELESGQLSLIPSSPRGGPGTKADDPRRKVVAIRIPHFQHDMSINADEVQGVRQFGSDNALQTVQSVVDKKMLHATRRLDLTLESLRLGAITGVVVDSAGTTLLDSFASFGVTRPADVSFALNTSTTEIRTICHQVQRTMEDNIDLPSDTLQIRALCGNDFFDKLISHQSVKSVYDNWAASEQRNAGNYAYSEPGFPFGGIIWENYRGTSDSTVRIGTSECRMFPVNVPGLFAEVYGPADYEEAINTVGLARYAKQYPWANGKGRTVEVQTNVVPYCTRPNVLIRGTA
jgi:hypothetical protein